MPKNRSIVKSEEPQPESSSGLEADFSLSDQRFKLKMSERVAMVAIIPLAVVGLVWMWQQDHRDPPADNRPEIVQPQEK